MIEQASFPIDDASRVGEARRHAARMAEAAGFNDVTAGRLALVVTELASNLHRHATQGRLLLSARSPDASRCIEVLAVDRGPGIGNVAACLRDGYSTRGTPGTGLGAVRRLADDFDLHSTVPAGTLVVARVRRRVDEQVPQLSTGPFDVGAATAVAPGETVCGDGWSFAVSDGRLALMVADGLGHGPQAAEAAHAALDVFDQQPFAAPVAVLERAHGRLRATRGAALSVAQADNAQATIRFAGAGNVVGRIVSGLVDRSLMPQNGSAGIQMRSLQEQRLPWPDHALLVVHTDGIGSRWDLARHGTLLQHDPSIVAGALLRDHDRGRDDATVVVVRRNVRDNVADGQRQAG